MLMPAGVFRLPLFIYYCSCWVRCLWCCRTGVPNPPPGHIPLLGCSPLGTGPHKQWVSLHAQLHLCSHPSLAQMELNPLASSSATHTEPSSLLPSGHHAEKVGDRCYFLSLVWLHWLEQHTFSLIHTWLIEWFRNDIYDINPRTWFYTNIFVTFLIKSVAKPFRRKQ